MKQLVHIKKPNNEQLLKPKCNTHPIPKLQTSNNECPQLNNKQMNQFQLQITKRFIEFQHKNCHLKEDYTNHIGSIGLTLL